MRIRREKRVWVLAIGLFVAMFSFAFLTAKFKSGEEAEAANLGNFDPGYIISDYQMGNYNSMSEAEIQAFLTAKNSCGNTDWGYYQRLSANTNYTWHWENGHFVCLSEERFGDGEVIGGGDTAAHIIWQAAQDYRINPQVLIVLLQKETGLITDPIPNNGDYRKATGYGCPDTAACSSKYYGFKNQVRNAAAMFRAVLDGEWTNYPLGSNYIQYNPNSGCGGSVVNIRSLATSALYRYTPYQPNAAALAAGYGSGDSCSAYGNRNFYSYFEDWFGGITSESKSMKIADGEYYVRSFVNNKLVIDVEEAAEFNGANIQLFDSNETTAQRWKISYNGSTDDYSIINSSSGKALDVSAASVENGANIQIWEANGTCAQRWKAIESSEGGVKFLSACSGKILSIDGDKMEIEANIYLYADKNSEGQRWDLFPVSEVEGGLYTITSAMNKNRVIDISGGVPNAGNGTNIQIWTNNGTAAQQWYIEKYDDGYYGVKNLQSGKYLDVSMAKKENGTNIQAWDGNRTCAQKWKILESGNVYEFISACSYAVIDLAAADTRAGTNIQLYEANNTGAQKWVLSSIETVKDGVYEIVSRVSEKSAIDLAGNKNESGTNIHLYERNGTFAQKWKIEYNTNDGFYTIHNSDKYDKVLDVAMAGRNNGANVQIWKSNNTCAQKWLISRVGEDYVFGSACSDLVIDVEAARKDNGTNIQLYGSNGTNAQKWKLVPVKE